MNPAYPYKKLNLVQIFSLTIQSLKSHPIDFLRFGSVLILFPVIGGLFKLFFNSFSFNSIFSSIPLLIVSYILFSLILSSVAIGCHRTFLMSDIDIKRTKTFRLGVREWNFFAWGIKIGFILLVPIFFLSYLISGFEDSLPDYFYMIASIPLLYLLSRLSLVFPATAVENSNTNVFQAWELSRHNGWRLTLLIGFIPLITGLLFESLGSFDSVLMFILAALTWLLVALIELGLLSISFSYLKGYIEDETDN